MGKLHTRVIHSATIALFILIGAIVLTFTVKTNTAHASTVTPDELTDLYISLGIVPAEHAEEAKSAVVGVSENIDLIELTELFIALKFIPTERTDDARAIVEETEAPEYVRSLKISPASPNSSVIAVDETSLTKDVLVFAIEISTSDAIDVYEVPIRIETGTKNIWDVIDDTYLYVNSRQHHEYFPDNCANTKSCVMTFDMAAGEVVGSSETITLYQYIDFRETMGNHYESGETIQVSINEPQADEIATKTLSITREAVVLTELLVNAGFVPGGNANNARTVAQLQSNLRTKELVELFISLGIIPVYEVDPVREFIVNDDEYDSMNFTGTAVGAKHTLITEGIFAEIVSTKVDTNSESSQATFKIQYDVTALKNDFYIGSTADTVTYHIERDGVRDTSIDTTATISSTATKENGNFRVSEGTTETFSLTVSIQPDIAGDYRLVLDSVEYSASNSGTLNDLSHTVTPTSDFRTNQVSIGCANCVVDKIAPVITLVGSSTINLHVGDTFSDPGATAVDAVDGDISNNIVITGDTVNTSTTSTSTIIYTVTDSAGNTSSISRLVVVLGEETNSDTTNNNGTADDSTTNDDSTTDASTTNTTNTTSSTSHSSGGGGGGGSSSRDRSAPKYTSISINNGDEGTFSRLVTLTLTATDTSNPITVQISNISKFENNGEWVKMKKTMSWVLSEGDGEKKVYARFKDSAGNISNVIVGEILLVEKEDLPSQITTPTSQTTGHVYGASAFKFLNDIALGARSNDVAELQKKLRSEGFFTHPTNTGYYGPATQAAVRAYQNHYGINPTGYVGPLTRTHLNNGTQRTQTEGGVSLKSFVQLLLALGIIPQEKTSAAMAAIATL